MMDRSRVSTYCLTAACPDKVGVVAALSQCIAQYHGWIIESHYHSDLASGQFFMRNDIRADSLSIDLEAFRRALVPLAKTYDMRWQLRDTSKPRKVVLLASQASHCLADLLHRWHSGELFCEIPAVISNHETLRDSVEWHGIPFHYVPIPSLDKAQLRAKVFAEISTLIDSYQADTVVLARYMQIIPPELCQAYAGRLINIHHSFLPSFVGAQPYQQAYDRGVKLIGATSHYVTEYLDEGPIIDQDTIRVSHHYTTEDLRRLGKDVEKIVLARALRYHLEDRVFICGNKTVVFS